MVKIKKTIDGEFIAIDSDGYLLNSKGETTDEMFDPLDLRKPIREYFWYNDLQGRFVQDTRKPHDYRGKPRIYVKEIIENVNGQVISHLLVYNGYDLLAKTKMNSPEYTVNANGEHVDDGSLRFEVRKFINDLLNKRIRVPTKYGGREEELIGTWRYYKIDEPYETFRKSKKVIPKSRKSTSKKVVKKVCKCKRK
jgi:hypothetical protein